MTPTATTWSFDVDKDVDCDWGLGHCEMFHGRRWRQVGMYGVILSFKKNDVVHLHVYIRPAKFETPIDIILYLPLASIF